MAINITDSSSTIKIEITADYQRIGYKKIDAQTVFIDKSDLDLKAIDNDVIIVDGENHYRFLYSDITSPEGASASAVIALIEAFKDPSTNPTSVQEKDGTTSTTSSVSGAVTAQTLKAANTSRVKLVVVNDSTAVLYVKEGSGATTTDYSYKLNNGDTVIIDDYNGLVTGIWASATGAAKITETT